MTYLQKSNFKNRKSGFKRRKTLTVVLLILAILILLTFFSPNFVPGKTSTIGKPFWKFKEVLLQETSGVRELLRSKKDLVIKNEDLMEENRKLRQRNLAFSLLEKENAQLKNALGREENQEITLARVLSKAEQSIYGTIIIDIGKNKARKGQEVFFENYIVIGTIEEVYENSSKVKLVSAPGNKYSVEIGENNIPAEAKGLGNGSFEIKLPRGTNINVGDEVVSPNLSIRLLGRVEHIDSSPENSLQTIFFQTPINVNEIKWLELHTTF